MTRAYRGSRPTRLRRHANGSTVVERYWTTAEDDFIFENYEHLTWGQIAVRLGRTPSAVSTRAHWLGLDKTRPAPVDPARNLAERRRAMLKGECFRDPRIASQWHLIDLKRAGYSPTMTELRSVPDDGIGFFGRAFPDRSPITSFASLCEDF